ncbi:hypothetical protein SRABI106_03516 [Rahnella aquatilis]|nr:hypothetical protein SRABI106_03516 [Rahnella aquatilis]
MGLTGMDPFSDEGREELLKRVQKNSERSTMWDDLKSWITSSSQLPAGYQDPAPWASLQNQSSYPFIPPQLQPLQGKIEVSVSDDRVQVKSVKINTPGVTLSAQSGVSNVEQD